MRRYHSAARSNSSTADAQLLGDSYFSRHVIRHEVPTEATQKPPTKNALPNTALQIILNLLLQIAQLALGGNALGLPEPGRDVRWTFLMREFSEDFLEAPSLRPW